MTKVCVFHNPRCSKSRQSLQLLKEHGIEPTIRLYLQDPPSHQELAQIVGKLGISAGDLVRRSEAVFKEQGLANADLSEADWIDTMVRNPKLIERPIVLVGDRAVLGRPPENVLSLLND